MPDLSQKYMGYYLSVMRDLLETMYPAKVTQINARPHAWLSHALVAPRFYYDSPRVSPEGYPNLQLSPDVTEGSDATLMQVYHRIKARVQIVGSKNEDELVKLACEHQLALLEIILENQTYQGIAGIMPDQEDFSELFIDEQDELFMTLEVRFIVVGISVVRHSPLGG